MSHTTDEEYEKLLERIVMGANFLDNPLIKPTDYERGLKNMIGCVLKLWK